MDTKHMLLRSMLAVLALLPACTQESVTAVPLGGVDVTPPAVSTPEGEQVQFAATVRDEQNESLDAAAVVWSSDDESVVTIEPDGTARAVAPGTTHVRASFRDMSGEARITVVSLAPPPEEDPGGGLLDDLPLPDLPGGLFPVN